MKLYQAILLSLLGHGALLLPQAEQSLPEIPVAPIQVSLNSESYQPVTDQPTSHQPIDPIRKTQHTDTRTEPRQIVRHESAGTTEPGQSQQEQRKAKQNERPTIPFKHVPDDTLSRQQAQTRVISRLHHELKNYFEYPLLARRNGWEGKVVLAMDIYLDGRIYNVQLKSGSGYRVLDRSALKAVSRIQTLPDVPGWRGDSPLNIAIPVIYRLQG